MAFCGQCGFLLAPGLTNCPRCGAVTPYNQPADTTGAGADNVTVKSRADTLQDGSISHTPALDYATPATPALPESGYPFDPRAAGPSTGAEQDSGATLPIDTSYPGRPSPPFSYPGSMPQSSGNYPPPGAPYPGFTPPAGAGHAAGTPGSPRKAKNLAPRLIILVVLLLVLAALALFVIQPDRLQAILGSHAATTPAAQPTGAPTSQLSTTAQPSPTPALTPEQEAQAVVTQYYTDINNRDYSAAYALWANYPQSEDAFAQGFAHTRHDEIVLGNSTIQSDGTVKVPITLTATADAPSGTGTQQSRYEGYYIVGQQPDGSWKIVTANMQAL